MTPTDLISVCRAARLANVHISTIYRWVDIGKITGYRKPGKGIVVSRLEIESLTVPIPLPPRLYTESPTAKSRAQKKALQSIDPYEEGTGT
jgi:excisionase family DNA binding protein